MFWMGLWSVFWLVLLGLAIWLLIRWLSGRTTLGTPHAPPNPPSALEILRQRYARGEIDTATFENMRERLNASGAREEPPVPLQR
jgi:putative membrane protein